MEKQKSDKTFNGQNRPYLLHFAIACANKGHSVATVIVGGHWGHAIVLIDEEWGTLDGAGPTKRLVEVLATEVVINLKRLVKRKKEVFRNRKTNLSVNYTFMISWNNKFKMVKDVGYVTLNVACALNIRM